MRAHRSRRGATLPEVLIVSAVLILMLTALLRLSTAATNDWASGTSKMMADSDASLAFQRLAGEVRLGLRASVNSSGTELTVVLPATNSQGDYDRFTEGASVRYFLLNGKLQRRVGTQTATVLGKNITDLKFTGSGLQIGLALTSRQKTGTKTGKTTYTTQVTLRNQPPT